MDRATACLSTAHDGWMADSAQPFLPEEIVSEANEIEKMMDRSRGQSETMKRK
jgi:hypothetical protein